MVIAASATAVLVHAKNPLDQLSLDELDAIFSAERRRGHPAIATWNDLLRPGLQLPEAQLMRYCLASSSFTKNSFMEQALRRGRFHADAHVEHGSTALAKQVAQMPGGIGFASPAPFPGVRLVPIAAGPGRPAVAPLPCDPMRYPIASLYYLYLDLPPGEQPAPAVAELLRLLLSRQGQEIVAKDGLLPLPAAWCVAQRRWLGLDP